ncbi:hypothetical protein V2S84_13450, partial [Azotobacter chroococcum]|nr:hypothetical protein [Azotobacter chroococcum]
LDETCYRGSAATAVVSDGMSAHTHIALISTARGERATRCYVKFYPDQNESGREHRGLVNELVGYVLATCMGAQTSRQAGFITLKSSQLATRPSWVGEHEEMVGWWTQDMAFPSLRTYYGLSDLDQSAHLIREKLAKAASELIASGKAPLIIAMDDLLADVDRNIGNLLRLRNGHYVLVDFGKCLTGDGWIVDDLDPGGSYPNKISAALVPESQRLPFRHAVVKAQESLAENLDQAIKALLKWLPLAVDAMEAASIENFIRRRAEPGSLIRRQGLMI